MQAKIEKQQTENVRILAFPHCATWLGGHLASCRLRGADADSKIVHSNTFIRICRDARDIFLTREVLYFYVCFFCMGEVSYLWKLKFWSKISDSSCTTHSFGAFFQMVRMAIAVQLTPQWFNHQSLLGDIIVATFVVKFSQIYKLPFDERNEWMQMTLRKKLTVISQRIDYRNLQNI